MPPSSSTNPAPAATASARSATATPEPAARQVSQQPCIRCGALLDVARFTPGAKVRCAACRSVNIAGERPLPRDRTSSLRLPAGDEEPLDRIFSGVSSAALPPLDEAGPASDTVDIKTIEKFQPALAGLAPSGGEGVSAAANRWSDQLEECQLGAYKIVRRIATGGMGTVYEADHIALHRKVALKILHRDIAGSPEIQERLHREAMTLARIRHPHIVEIFDIGNFEGRPFLVMEFIAGGDLKTPLTARGMEEREALRIGAEIAEAVDYAHQRGIIHRDLKPANILLDEAQSVHVADFGLAKVIGASTQLTATGTTVGTPAYMAPEQARGQTDQLDARADVYSIGAILYEMLTGQPPFSGAHLMDVLYKVVHERPPHPQKVNPKISADAATICLKAMAQRPEDRYESAWALMSDLEALLHGDSIQARPPNPAALLFRNMKKYVAIWAMAALLVLGLGFETGRFVVAEYRIRLAAGELRTIRAAMAAPLPPESAESSATRLRIERCRRALNDLDALYRKSGFRPAQEYQQTLERDLQQWLAVDRLRTNLGEAEAQMAAGKYRDAEIQLGLIAQSDPGPAASEAYGEIQALKTAARLRAGQLVDLRESRELAGLKVKMSEVRRKLGEKDFAGAEEDLRGMLIEIAADLEIFQTEKVIAELAGLQTEASLSLRTASKHREEQMAAKLQKDLATQLDPFKAIPGISDLMSHWMSRGNPGANPAAEAPEDGMPLPDPELATPPGVTPAHPVATAPPPLAGPQPPSVSDVLKAIVGPGVAPAKNNPPPEAPAPAEPVPHR